MSEAEDNRIYKTGDEAGKNGNSFTDGARAAGVIFSNRESKISNSGYEHGSQHRHDHLFDDSKSSEPEETSLSEPSSSSRSDDYPDWSDSSSSGSGERNWYDSPLVMTYIVPLVAVLLLFFFIRSHEEAAKKHDAETRAYEQQRSAEYDRSARSYLREGQYKNNVSTPKFETPKNIVQNNYAQSALGAKTDTANQQIGVSKPLVEQKDAHPRSQAHPQRASEPKSIREGIESILGVRK